MDGSVAELSLLSFAKFYSVVNQNPSGVDVFLAIMAFIMMILLILHALRPIYYICKLKSLQDIPQAGVLPTTPNYYLSPFYNRMLE